MAKLLNRSHLQGQVKRSVDGGAGTVLGERPRDGAEPSWAGATGAGAGAR